MNYKNIFFTTAMIAVLTAAGCQNSGTTSGKGNPPAAETDDQSGMEEKITRDILSLPEMKFENAAVEIAGTPSDGEPYYTVKGGSNTETHFAASLWFHVYTEPYYEIRVYDVVTDSEMTLQQWRDSREETSAETFLANVKFDAELPDGRLRLLADRLLWISGDDTETLLKYGFDPDDVANDYELYNEKEEWIPIVTSAETVFNIVRYVDGYPAPYDVDITVFKQDIVEKAVNYIRGGDRIEHTIMANITVAEGVVLSVREVYVP